MKFNTKLAAAALLAAGLAGAAPAPAASIEGQWPVPASLCARHAEILQQVAALAEQPAPVGPEARELQTLLLAHVKYVEDVILPPLTLLPAIAQTDIGPDMTWALPLVERARVEQVQTAKAHEDMTDRLVRLFAAAQRAEDAQAGRVAQDIAAWLQSEAEVTEPAAQVVGKYLRLRYASRS